MGRPLVVGNWKMHGSQAMVAGLTEDLLYKFPSDLLSQVAVLPPFVYLSQVKEALSERGIAFGAQNLCHAEGEGAFTGEVSATMLKELGCTYVLVGHSERRQWFGEAGDVLVQKCTAAQKAGLIPIYCIGETLADREEGLTEPVLAEQLADVLGAEGVAKNADQLVIAYEPVWAIGTGVAATAEEAGRAHQFIRGEIGKLSASLAEQVTLLYGGSVKPDNARTLFAMPDVDGGLIGGASLDGDAFLAICESLQ